MHCLQTKTDGVDDYDVVFCFLFFCFFLGEGRNKHDFTFVIIHSEFVGNTEIVTDRSGSSIGHWVGHRKCLKLIRSLCRLLTG